jgi:hypothetical protein
MRKLLLVAAALGALSLPASAAVVTDLGLDPTSATGAFNHSLGALTGSFDDQYTFHLDHSLTLTIASVTNVFPGGTSSSDFITGFTGSVFAGTPGSPGAQVIGPVTAQQGCGPITNCQGFAGSAILASGFYFLDISGIAGGSSGYGGNLATFASEVPLPAAVWLFGGGLAGLGAMLRRRKQSVVA